MWGLGGWRQGELWPGDTPSSLVAILLGFWFFCLSERAAGRAEPGSGSCQAVLEPGGGTWLQHEPLGTAAALAGSSAAGGQGGRMPYLY